MIRRELIFVVSALALLHPPMASAQESGRIYRLGFLSSLGRANPPYGALFDELRRLGFIENQNLMVDPRGFGLPDGRFAEVAAELVKAPVDVIVASGDDAIRAVQGATATIPILGSADDMVGSGLVASMAHPGGNTTGTSIFSTELDGKRQEALTEIVPKAGQIAALADANTTASSHLQALQDAAREHGVGLSVYRVATSEEIAPAIDAAKAAGADALNVLASPFLRANEQPIRDRTAALKLPTIYQFPKMAEAGGLAAYGPRIDELYRTVQARQLGDLLKGAKPADLPIEQPTRFELIINLKTAKALGLTVPPSMLDLADGVIE